GLDFEPFHIFLFGYRNEIAHVKHPVNKRIVKQFLGKRCAFGALLVGKIEAEALRYQHFVNHKFQRIWVGVRLQVDMYGFWCVIHRVKFINTIVSKQAIVKLVHIRGLSGVLKPFSVPATTVATTASPVTLTMVRHISSGRSIAMISASPSTETPIAPSTMTRVTRPALGTAAAPMDDRVAVRMIIN